MAEPEDRDGSVPGDKPPATVTPTVGTARKAPAKAAAKRPVKKAPVKKAASKKPAKKAAPAKSPVSKTAATKVPAKKASPKKSPAKKAPVKKAAPTKTPAKKAPPAMHAHRPAPSADPQSPDPATAERAGRRRRQHRPDAVCVSVTQDLLNDVLLIALGAGIPLEALDTSVVLPGMGEVDVRLALTITGGTLDLRPEDRGLARVVVTAVGDVSIRTVAADGVVEQSPSIAEPPAPVPVVVEALMRPLMEIDDADHLHVALSLEDAVLISLRADTSAPVPDGVDPGAWTGVLTMFGMVFDVLGAGLFETLAEHVGQAGMDLGPTVGLLLRDVGVARGLADISVSSGVLTIALRGSDGTVGAAPVVPVSGRSVGIGIADSVVDRVARMALAQAAGNLPVPFDLEVDLGDQQVEGRFRQPRLLPEGLPDLRGTFHTEVRPRLAGGQLELAVQSAWVEFPSIVPSVFNRVSRRLGNLVSLAPARVRFPATISLPVIPGSDDGLPIRVDSLQVTSDGLGVVLELA